MYVVKRDGRQEPLQLDKIAARLQRFSYGLNAAHCDPVLVAHKVCAGVYNGVTTTQLDELAAETTASMATNHPDYALLAARISVSNLHKSTKESFSETIRVMYNFFDQRSGKKAPLVADDVHEIIMKNASRLDSEIIYERDFDYDYFGFKTLERSYLLKVNEKIVERPQHMLMRVSVGIHKDDIESALQTYHLMSQRWFIHATPTLFNGGTPQPQEEHRARDLFYALWIPDLFMERVQGDGQWSLFCPNEAPGLADVWGEKFEKLYTQYEDEGKAKKVIPARKLWFEMLNSQIETGTPFMLFKDSCNRKSNQQNLGTIKSSNLCTEIIEFTSPTETAVCNLASIALPRYVKEKASIDTNSCKMIGSRDSKNRYFDFDKLAKVTKIVTANLNKIIDVNYYPIETAKRSNLQHRPVGIGVQGLADTFILLGMPFDSPEGILQVDMWGVTPSDRWDWGALRQMISKNGLRNSLLVAPMPTASTSQILGNNECFEPYTSNIYSRRVLSGEFVVVNKHLLHDLTEMGLWSHAVKSKIIYENGSISNIPEIPEELKAIYKSVWEIKQKTLVDMAADRGCYIDQSQSLNIHMDQPDLGKLTSLHFYAWSKGLKTGMYYLRTRAAADAIKFTVDISALNNDNNNKVDGDVNADMPEVCFLQNREECMACGS